VSSEVSHDINIITDSEVDEDVRFLSSSLLKGAVLLELRDEISELKFEIILLKDEVIKNQQRIISLESEKKNYGKDVKKRVSSMLLLIKEYGGSLKSSSIKKYMGLSKDELYRTLKCAKEEKLIEVLPDPHDRRGYIINIKQDIFEKSFQDSRFGTERPPIL
jgi:DNA-binding MarR family transcriptional regulator